jgi:hypothetical protein
MNQQEIVDPVLRPETNQTNEQTKESAQEEAKFKNKKPSSVVLNENDENNNNELAEGASTILQSPVIQSPLLYENDFDLYNLLKDMTKSTDAICNNVLSSSSSEAVVKSVSLKRTHKAAPYKDYTRMLTARLLDSHYADGKNEWCSIDKGMDLYRIKTKCIGTDVNDFGNGEAVLFDLQPLSTRIKLMCKLIIIIQGACLERNGPPKLVQDRCIQFDGVVSSEAVPTAYASGGEAKAIVLKIKSSSCEDLLNDSSLLNSSATITTPINNPQNQIAASTEIKAISNGSNEIKVSVFGTSYLSDSHTPKPRRKKQLAKNTTIEKSSNNCVTSDDCLTTTASTSASYHYYYDDLISGNGSQSPKQHYYHHYHHHHYYPLDNGSLLSNERLDNRLVSSLNCDLENYYTYRKSKYSTKDYASLPYYQYSANKNMQSEDKSVNTQESYLQSCKQSPRQQHKKKNMNNISHTELTVRFVQNGTVDDLKPTFIKTKAHQSTSTDDLLDNFLIGYYSKQQLLSSQSLFDKKTSLMNSFANITTDNVRLAKQSKSQQTILNNEKTNSSTITTTTTTTTTTMNGVNDEDGCSNNAVTLINKFSQMPIQVNVNNKLTTRTKLPINKSSAADDPAKPSLASADSDESDSIGNCENDYDEIELLRITKNDINENFDKKKKRNQMVTSSSLFLKPPSTTTTTTSQTSLLKDGSASITMPMSLFTTTSKYNLGHLNGSKPKKSSEWSIFKNKTAPIELKSSGSTKLISNDDKASSMKKLATITTTTTTTTTFNKLAGLSSSCFSQKK